VQKQNKYRDECSIIINRYLHNIHIVNNQVKKLITPDNDVVIRQSHFLSSVNIEMIADLFTSHGVKQ